uniref:U6 snRNA-associated Sm-like protein LSm1 n=1 Tax=Meloidogyne floridensis TaxID=298350 RepID=A0A915P170_9BILA
MELPDPYLPGAVSLLDQLDKKLVVVLRDGKTLIGYLRTLDQVSIEEILRLQAEKLEEKNRFNHTKQQFLRGSGKVQPVKKNDEMMDEY